MKLVLQLTILSLALTFNLISSEVTTLPREEALAFDNTGKLTIINVPHNIPSFDDSVIAIGVEKVFSCTTLPKEIGSIISGYAVEGYTGYQKFIIPKHLSIYPVHLQEDGKIILQVINGTQLFACDPLNNMRSHKIPVSCTGNAHRVLSIQKAANLQRLSPYRLNGEWVMKASGYHLLTIEDDPSLNTSWNIRGNIICSLSYLGKKSDILWTLYTSPRQSSQEIFITRSIRLDTLKSHIQGKLIGMDTLLNTTSMLLITANMYLYFRNKLNKKSLFATAVATTVFTTGSFYHSYRVRKNYPGKVSI